MKIGLDYRSALFSQTGIARYVTELTRALADEGHDLRLLGDAWRRVENERSLEIETHPNAPRLFRNRLPGRVQAALGVLGYGVELRLGSVGIFHHTDLCFAPVRKAPTVVTVHDLAFEVDASFHEGSFRKTVSRRLKRQVQRSQGIICPSEETKGQLIDRYAVVPDRVTVIPNGVDHILTESDRATDEEVDSLLEKAGVGGPFILCLGTLEPRKNHRRLLEAFVGFEEKHPHSLVLVGKIGWMVDDVQDMIREGRERGRVYLLENLDDRFLPGVLDRCEFSVYPSLYEGFGFPVLESMARGRPTLTTRRGALSEVGGGAVLYCEPDDSESIRDGLERLADDGTMRSRLSDAGRQRAQGFTWKKSALAHVRAYEQAASLGGKGCMP